MSARRSGGGSSATPEPRGDRAQRQALDEDGDDDDVEDDVEDRRARGQAGDDRERGEHDRHAAAQARPGEEALLAQRDAERRERRRDGQRPRDEHQHRGDDERLDAAALEQLATASRAGRAGRTGRSARASAMPSRNAPVASADGRRAAARRSPTTYAAAKPEPCAAVTAT